jgi:hypothetical protein
MIENSLIVDMTDSRQKRRPAFNEARERGVDDAIAPVTIVPERGRNLAQSSSTRRGG